MSKVINGTVPAAAAPVTDLRMIMAELQQLKVMVQALSDAMLRQQRFAELEKQQMKQSMAKTAAQAAAEAAAQAVGAKASQAGAPNAAAVNFGKAAAR